MQVAAVARRRVDVRSLGSLALFLGTLAVLSYRLLANLNIPGQPDETNLWLGDFRDAIYYPVVALLDGNNPYDVTVYRRTYPVQEQFPLYSPHSLVLHLPFGLLPYEVAEVMYFLLTIALTAALAALTLHLCAVTRRRDRVLSLTALILLSRPGYWNLLFGQSTLQIVIGCYLALRYAEEQPWVAGLGLALSAVKPTFGIPLAGLLLAQRNFRAVAIGVTVAGGLSLVPLAAVVHAAGGIRPFLDAALQNHTILQPIPNALRIDTVALWGRLVGRAPTQREDVVISMGLLGLGMLAVGRLAAASERTRWLRVGLACLTILTFTYHQNYDLLLLTLPLVALATDPEALLRAPDALRWTLVGLMATTFANHLVGGAVVNVLRLGSWERLVVASLNGLAVLAALLTLSAIALLAPARRFHAGPTGTLRET